MVWQPNMNYVLSVINRVLETQISSLLVSLSSVFLKLAVCRVLQRMCEDDLLKDMEIGRDYIYQADINVIPDLNYWIGLGTIKIPYD